MLNLRNIVGWAVARTAELGLGALLLIGIFGPNTLGSQQAGFEDYRENLHFVFFFFLSSGYILSTAWFAVVKRRARSPLLQMWVSILLFVLHSTVFLVIAAHVDAFRMLLLLIFGSCVVAFSRLIEISVQRLFFGEMVF